MKIATNLYILALAGLTVFCSNCNEVYDHPPSLMVFKPSVLQTVNLDSSLRQTSETKPYTNKIFTGNTTPQQLLNFAHTLKGIPYKYASAIPDSGFDCSGFITYVFNRFNISVPRASASFVNIEKEIQLALAQPGDLILFTGTDTSIHTVGHMGIIDTVKSSQISFIHASSGKANGVTISTLDNYYMSRFVKLIRVFP